MTQRKITSESVLEADRLHHYRSGAGREIDVIVDLGETCIAIEIKSTEVPGKRDLRNLEEFAGAMKRPVRCVLFYTGIDKDTGTRDSSSTV